MKDNNTKKNSNTLLTTLLLMCFAYILGIFTVLSSPQYSLIIIGTVNVCMLLILFVFFLIDFKHNTSKK